MIDIKKVVNMQEDEISEYIEGLGLESAFDEGGFLKRIWGKLSTTRFLVGHVNAALNELKSLEKIDIKKIKEETTEHSISALDLRVIEDAMDIVEIGKGIPERLQSHAMRAFEIIKKIDKKIFMAKDATDTRYVPGGEGGDFIFVSRMATHCIKATKVLIQGFNHALNQVTKTISSISQSVKDAQLEVENERGGNTNA